MYINGARQSWDNTNNFKYQEQLNFMKNERLLFDEMVFKYDPYNSVHMIPYDITVNKIGIDKAMLNTASTWKTMGIVTVKRIDYRGRYYVATLATPPMEANADIKSNLSIGDNYTLNSNEDNISLGIDFSAEAINLRDYADAKHIKEIVSILYIDNKEVARVSGSKTTRVDKHINFVVSRDNDSPKKYQLNIKVKSYLYTEFYADGLLQNELQKNININIEEKNIVPVNTIKLSVLKLNNLNNWVVSPLVHTIITDNQNSEGFLENGRYIIANIQLNNITTIDNMELYLDNKKINIANEKDINKFDNAIIYRDNKKILIKISTKELSNTLENWSTLREENKNYFDIDLNKLGIRKNKPHELILKLSINNKEYEYNSKFDSIDNFNQNINYIFNKNITNSNELKDEIKLEDIISEK